MPELPDVEVMRQYLQSTALHREIVDVTVRAESLIPDDATTETRTVKQLKGELQGRTFETTRRHGKWLFVGLDSGSGKSLVLHFGMTSGLKYFKDRSDEPEYTKVLFRFDNGYHLAYHSTRKLGEVEVIDSVDDFIDQKDLGPDAQAIDREKFKAAVEGRRMMAKSLLMDQDTIAGIGNVYSDEILFQAGIHPRTKVNALDEDALEGLFHTMKDVLETAIEYQAEPEQFPEPFITPHRHEDGHCPRCGAALERVRVGSRHGYYCPNRQEKR